MQSIGEMIRDGGGGHRMMNRVWLPDRGREHLHEMSFISLSCCEIIMLIIGRIRFVEVG